MMPDLPFLVLGLLSDIGWIIHLIAGIVYFGRNGWHHVTDGIALLALADDLSSVACLMYLNKIGIGCSGAFRCRRQTRACSTEPTISPVPTGCGDPY